MRLRRGRSSSGMIVKSGRCCPSALIWSLSAAAIACPRRLSCADQGAGSPVYGDVYDPASLDDALAGREAAYYLVHSLGDRDFEGKDAAAAVAFGHAAGRAGLRRIIYLGGLGDDRDALSAHLRSRRLVEKLLGSAGVPVTVIRAGIIVGHGSISWS